MASQENPKRGLGICPASLNLEGERELGSAAEPGPAAFPSLVLVAVTLDGVPIPLGTRAGG